MRPIGEKMLSLWRRMNSIDHKTTATAMLAQYLAQHKMRRTPERFAILEKVFDTQGHFSIETLHAELEEEGYHVSRATLYNTIQLLLQCGLVRRNQFASQSPRYEKVADLSRHYHLICSRCGKVREIKDAVIDRMLTTLRFGKFHPAYIDLNIYGLCGSCSRKSRITTGKSKKPNKSTI